MTDIESEGGQDKIEPEEDKYQIFLRNFFEKYRTQIDRTIYKFMIANRYSFSDVRAYMAERILDTLRKREAKGRPIEDPEKYFRTLLRFYCVEFQRMHGFIYCLPKRPLDKEAENEISKYGFFYFYTADDNNENDQVGYVEASLYDHSLAGEFSLKGEDPGINSEAWRKLMLMALPEDRDVLECIFIRGMSVLETSKHLSIATATVYHRRERGLRSISGTLATYVDLDSPSWKILENVQDLDDDVVDIRQFFIDLKEDQ
ncbi:MAG: hypothetical protein D6710_01795 [Nitrospirae bacterium]|nr:MAG: hypothetical protein D6710_01795 [Nitrospirota bacterium]